MTSYQGGKKKLGYEIYQVIKKYDKDETVPYFEPFCGMCGVLIHFAKENNNRKIIASDINKDLILMWKNLQKGWKPPTNCAKKYYNELKEQKKPSAERGFIGTVCSFSGMFFKGGFRKKSKSHNFVRSGRIGVLNAVKYLQNVKFKSKSYDEYNPKGFLIYCDPPYKNNKIANDTFENFDHDKFWDLMRKWSKNNIVIISEKTAPKDFKCIWKKQYNVSFYNNKFSKNIKKKLNEKLFIHDDNNYNL